MLTGAETTDLIVFWIVAGARFLLPLAIPRYPLPAILAAMVLDGIDQTLFQQFTNLDLTGYQGYDKALDIYYLAIAYITTLRNWSNHFAFQVSRFLFYWRLAGVALFELTQLRALLLIFPNTFEYFFIFYEAYRLRWDPKRMSKGFLIGAAAAIWIVIKLPQEWWIHIAQLDATDFIKENIFGVAADAAWREAVANRPGVVVVAIVVVVLLAAAIWWLARRLPPADYRLSFDADRHQPAFGTEQVRQAIAEEARHIVDVALAEKIVLLALVSLIFAQVLPEVRASSLQLVAGVGAIVTVNTVLSHWLARRGFGWAFSLWQFAAMVGVNAALILGYAVLRSRVDAPVSIANSIFFVLLLSLLVTLYDRYRQVYLMRFGLEG